MNNNEAIAFLNKAKEEINSIHNAITDPVLKITKDQMAKILSKLSNLSGTMQDLGVTVGVLEGKVMTFEKIIEKKVLPQETTPICDVLAEIEERKTRSKNVILLNVPECNSNSTTVSVLEDGKKVLAAISEINSEFNLEDVKIYRLGSKIPNKTRPIKLEFDEVKQAKLILFNKTTLSNGIIIKPDRTLQQRNHLTDLWKELEERKEKGEVDLRIKHFNGIPKIIKTQAKN